MSPRLNSCNLICLTVRGLVITNTECHFQLQTLHSVTHTNCIESKDSILVCSISSLGFYLRLKIPEESSAQNYL